MRKLGTQPRVLAVAMCALLVSSACGGDGGESSRTSTTSAASGATTATDSDDGQPSFLDLPANPFPVTFSIDDAASVTEDIGEAGGVLTTAGPDGTEYTLTFPEGAVLGPVEITMTPISLADSPLDDAFIWGVALEPDGLALLEPGTLEIGLVDADPETTAFFNAGGKGEDFHLALGELGETAEVAILHFSTAGAIRAQKAEINQLYDEYRPTERSHRYVQELTTVITRVKDLQPMTEALDRIFAEWLDAIRADTERAADGSTIERLFAEWLVVGDLLKLWLKDKILEHLPDDVKAAPRDGDGPLFPTMSEADQRAGRALHSAMYELFREENLRCIQERNPDAFFAMYRWALLVTWFERTINNPGYYETSRGAEMVNALEQCMRFELRFTSTAKGTAAPIEFSVTLEGTIPLDSSGGNTLSLEDGRYVGPIVEDELEGSGTLTAPVGPENCTSTYPIRAYLLLGIDVRFGDLEHSTFTEGSLGVGFEEAPAWACGIYQSTMSGLLWWPWWQTHVKDLPLVVPGGLKPLDLTQVQPGTYTHSSTSTVASEEGETTVTVDVTVKHDPRLP